MVAVVYLLGMVVMAAQVDWAVEVAATALREQVVQVELAGLATLEVERRELRVLLLHRAEIAAGDSQLHWAEQELL